MRSHIIWKNIHQIAACFGMWADDVNVRDAFNDFEFIIVKTGLKKKFGSTTREKHRTCEKLNSICSHEFINIKSKLNILILDLVPLLFSLSSSSSSLLLLLSRAFLVLSKCVGRAVDFLIIYLK
jgi:hypothetical protein